MATTDSPAYPDNEIESLIAALTGVLAARVVTNPLGRIEEIHVLADEQLHPKQMVRNIESALSAGLGVTVDRRLVSIAQVRGDPEPLDEPAVEEPAEQSAPTPAAPADDTASRYIFVGYDARTQP